MRATVHPFMWSLGNHAIKPHLSPEKEKVVSGLNAPPQLWSVDKVTAVSRDPSQPSRNEERGAVSCTVRENVKGKKKKVQRKRVFYVC